MLSLVGGVYCDIIKNLADPGYNISDAVAVTTRLVGKVIKWKSLTDAQSLALTLQGANNDVDTEYVTLDTSVKANETREIGPFNYRFLRIIQNSRTGGTYTTAYILCDEGGVGLAKESGGTLTAILAQLGNSKDNSDKHYLANLAIIQLLLLHLVETRLQTNIMIETQSLQTVDQEASRLEVLRDLGFQEMPSLLR